MGLVSGAAAMSAVLAARACEATTVAASVRAADTGGFAQADDIDPTPSSRGFIAMLEAYRTTGGLAPGNFLCRSLQAGQRGDLAHLARLVVDRRVFVLDWRGESWIPMFQFDDQGLSCKPGPAVVRAQLEGLASGWAVAAWFAAPNALLEGRRPAALVESDLPRVLHAARCHAAVPEAWRRSLVPA